MISRNRKKTGFYLIYMTRNILYAALLYIVINTSVNGQTIKALHSENDSEFPKLSWYSTSIKDTSDFKVYRTGLKKTDYTPIQTLRRSYIKGDTLFFRVTDTTLTEKALYRYFVTLPYKNDSAVRSEVIYGHNIGRIQSPVVINFKAEPDKEKKAINLSWKLNYNFTVNTLSIYRSNDYEDGYEQVAQLPGDAESYVDRVDVSNEAYYYFVVIHDYFGNQKPSVRFHGIATYAEKPAPPQNVKLNAEDNIIKLQWNRFGNNIVGYRVYRQVDNLTGFVPVNSMFYTPEKEVLYIDSTVSRLKNKKIEYFIVSVSDGFLESSPSDTLSYYIRGDIFKSAPKECNYIIDSLNRIMLIWTSQEADPEVKGYNVFRIDNDGKRERLNEQLIPYNVNSFTDTENTGTGEYIYEIETVSITNTPSPTKAVSHVMLYNTTQHLILSLSRTAKGIQIKAVPLSDQGIKEIVLCRQVNSGDLTTLKTLSPANINYTDTNVTKGELYSYSAIAVYNDKTSKIVNGGVVIRY